MQGAACGRDTITSEEQLRSVLGQPTERAPPR